MSWVTTWRRAQIVAVAVAVAVAVNLLIYAMGHLAGASYELTRSGVPMRVTAGTVAGFTATPLAVGLLVAAALGHRWPRFLPIAHVAVPALAIGTILVMTVPADLDTPSTIALAASHLTLIPPCHVVLSELQRRNPTITFAADQPDDTSLAHR